MTDPVDLVGEFLELLETGRGDAAVALLHPDIAWCNTGMPTFRGKRVVAMLRDMEQRGVGFRVDMHHIAGSGQVVLTDRTDHLSYRRWTSSFWVCGTFEVKDGLIVLWDDHFSPGNFVAASLKGLIGLARPRR